MASQHRYELWFNVTESKISGNRPYIQYKGVWVSDNKRTLRHLSKGKGICFIYDREIGEVERLEAQEEK